MDKTLTDIIAHFGEIEGKTIVAIPISKKKMEQTNGSIKLGYTSINPHNAKADATRYVIDTDKNYPDYLLRVIEL